MNTRHLTKKYKHKSRSKKTRRSRKSRRRILKGGVIPRGIVIRRTSGRSSASVRHSSASIRPSSSAGISKNKNNFNFECFYKKLMNTPLDELPSTIQDSRNTYIQATTLQNVKPKDS